MYNLTITNEDIKNSRDVVQSYIAFRASKKVGMKHGLLRCLFEIYDAVDSILDGDESQLEEVGEQHEELLDICKSIEDILSADALYELIDFDSEDFVNEQLQEEYGMEVYEENLEPCIGKASEQERAICHDLVNAAKDDIDELLGKMKLCADRLSDFTAKLKSRHRQINSEIDNTLRCAVRRENK